MSTCRDCFNYSLCDYNTNISVDDSKVNLIFNEGAENCSFFKDKSKIVELPCKVGDIVYQLWYTECHLGENYPDSYGCCGCMDECDAKLDVKPFVVPNLNWIFKNYFNFNNGIGSYYCNKEEAEKVLEKQSIK